jgi:hypothetical protein
MCKVRMWKLSVFQHGLRLCSLVIKEVGYENLRWMDLTQASVQWRTLVSAILNIQILLQEH